MLKDYDTSVLYHPNKTNVVAYSLSCMTMGSASHVEEDKKDLVKDLPNGFRLSRLGVRLEDSPNGGFMVHHNYESSFVVEVKSKKHLDQPLMDLMKSILSKLNESISLGSDDVLRYQGRLCVSNVDDFRNQLIEKAHGSCYSIHPNSTMMYHDLREVFWWEVMKKDIAEFVAKCPNCN